jgi:hypothetical protein
LVVWRNNKPKRIHSIAFYHSIIVGSSYISTDFKRRPSQPHIVAAVAVLVVNKTQRCCPSQKDRRRRQPQLRWSVWLALEESVRLRWRHSIKLKLTMVVVQGDAGATRGCAVIAVHWRRRCMGFVANTTTVTR